MPTPLGGGQWPGSQVGGPRILQCGPGSISLGEAATPSEVGWGAGRFQHPQLTLWERSNFHRTYIPGDHGPRLEPRVVKLDRCRHSQGRLHLGERHHACPSVTSSARIRSYYEPPSMLSRSGQVAIGFEAQGRRSGECCYLLPTSDRPVVLRSAAGSGIQQVPGPSQVELQPVQGTRHPGGSLGLSRACGAALRTVIGGLSSLFISVLPAKSSGCARQWLRSKGRCRE